MEGIGQFAAAGDDAEDGGAARGRGLIAFQHQRAGAFRHHEAVAVLRERLGGGLRRIVLGRQRRQQRKANQRFRIDRAVGARRTARRRPRRGGSPRRRAGSRWRRRRRRSTARSASPWCRSLGEMAGDRAEHEAVVIGRELAAAADAQQVVVGRIPCLPTARPSSRRCGHSTSTGATARNSGPGKSPLLPMPDCSSASSVAISASRSVRPVEENGSTGTKSTVPAIVVFRPSIGKRRHGADAGFARGEFRPVVGLAGAERGDDAHAGNDDDRPAEFVAWCCHGFPAVPPPFI